MRRFLVFVPLFLLLFCANNVYAQKINEIGQQISQESGVSWLPSDFKKKNGYKRSVELSARYELYRQDYCGCSFSKAEREAEKNREG